MVKLQVQLHETQLKALKTLAVTQNKPLADLIQQAVDTFLRAVATAEKQPGRVDADKEERKRRAIAAAGRFSSDVPNLASEHDRYLLQAYSG